MSTRWFGFRIFHKRPGVWLLILSLAVGSLLVVACGGSDDDSESGQSASTSTEAVATLTTRAEQTPTDLPEATPTTAPPTVTEPEAEEITLSVEQYTGSTGPGVSDHFAYIFTGLTPRGEYIIVTKLPDGTEDRSRVTADSGGTYLIAAEAGPFNMVGDQLGGWDSVPGEPPGEYVVQLLSADGETVLAEDTFTVTEEDVAGTPVAP